MPAHLYDSNILITGGNTGIGAATVRLLAAEGARIALTYRANRAEADAVAQEASALGAREVLVLRMDVTDAASVQGGIADVMGHLGGIDSLVCNAGALTRTSIADLTDEALREMVLTNFTGAVRITRECLPYLKQTVITVGTAVLRMPQLPNMSIYRATKAALQSYTEALALERPDLHVYCVHPGLTDTRMGAARGVPAGIPAAVIVDALKGVYQQLPPGASIDVQSVSTTPPV